MAEQERRKAGAEPISRHPLFPVIVALWVGALFGLASIAVSPSAIEGLVIATGIDKVLPMAAPPLGSTMRIMLALGMTAIGAGIGLVIARRVAGTPRAPERISMDAAIESEAPVEADAVSDAPVEEEQAEILKPGGRLPGRRRALALDTQEQDEAPAAEERAPMPAVDPQILNVAEFDIDHFDQPEPAPAFRPAPVAREIIIADDDLALPAWLEAETPRHDAEEPAPFQQVFQAHITNPDIVDELDEETTEAAAPPPFASRLFEAYSREDDAEPARPGFQSLPRLHAVPDSTEQRFEPEPVAAEWEEPVDAVNDDGEPEMQGEPAPQPEPVAQAEDEAPVEAPRARASNWIADADLDDLSPVELLERLAHAMAMRREEARRATEAAAAAAFMPEPIVAEFTPLREVAPRFEDDAPSSFETLTPAPFAAPAPFLTPVIDSVVEPEATIETIVEAEEDEATDQPAVVPAALRPVGFGAADEAEFHDEALPGYLPPRHIGLTAVDTTFESDEEGDVHAAFNPAPFPLSPFTVQDSGDDEDDGVLEQGYSSLLNLSRQSSAHFVRADEAHDDTVDHEPAQDMLGTETSTALPFARPTLATPVTDDGETIQAAPEPAERLFDAPASTAQEANERALRDALATLQRMSGAA